MLKQLQQIRKERRGFTLIELLISIVIFMVFLGIVSQSYVSIVRAQRQANEVRKMYSDVRAVLDFIAEEVRLSAIDYDCYHFDAAEADLSPLYCPEPEIIGTLSQANTQNSHLALIKKGGNEKTVMKLVDGQLMLQKHARNQAGSWGPAPGYEEYRFLTSDRITFEHLSFAIYPDVNPYSGDIEIYRDNGTQFQPKVTVFMSVRNADNIQTDFDYQFQTTISSRVYSRII